VLATIGEVALWLVVNTAIPLLPIPLFYMFLWIFHGAIGAIRWVTPIRDGQICFYSTTVAVLAVRDIYDTHVSLVWAFFGLVGCWIVSLMIYGFSVFTTIYPPAVADRNAIDARYALASIFCGVLTTVVVVGLRYHYGVLNK
jgi:hypothetical protein